MSGKPRFNAPFYTLRLRPFKDDAVTFIVDLVGIHRVVVDLEQCRDPGAVATGITCGVQGQGIGHHGMKSAVL